MSHTQIAVVVGSLRRDSFNRKLASAIVKLAPSDFSFKQVQIGNLPLYNQDDDATPSDPVKQLKAEIAASQGLLFVTPEYNRSIPGVLKNAIDHASRPYGQNAWAGKPAGVIGASVGAIGTSMAQQLCATCWRISTCRRWASLKRLSMQKKDCLMRMAVLAWTAKNSCRPGWTGMRPG